MYCEIVLSICQTLKPCHNGAICVDSDNSTEGYSCMCMSGFSGQTCRMIVDACANSPCENGGLCTPTGAGQFSCLCLPGYGGPTCTQAYDACASRPCLHGGTCVCNSAGSYLCTCTQGKKF